jgi:hypothetical protein
MTSYFASGTGAAGLVGAFLWWEIRGLGVRVGVGLSSVRLKVIVNLVILSLSEPRIIGPTLRHPSDLLSAPPAPCRVLHTNTPRHRRHRADCIRIHSITCI